MSSASSYRLTTWCGGWEPGLIDQYPWDLSACQGTGGASQCVVPPAQVDGHLLRPARVLFADGHDHTSAFGTGPVSRGLGSPRWLGAPPS